MHKKILIAALLGTCAMPAQAFTYLVYEGSGLGSYSDVNSGIGSTAGVVTLKMIVPLDPPDNPFAYYQTYWSFSGNSVTGYRPVDRDWREVTLTFDHTLTAYPTSSSGFVGGSVTHFGHWNGIRGSIDNLRVSTFTSDELRGSIEIGFAAFGVPEPASWAMMIGGLALAGSVLRRHKTVIAFA